MMNFKKNNIIRDLFLFELQTSTDKPSDVTLKELPFIIYFFLHNLLGIFYRSNACARATKSI